MKTRHFGDKDVGLLRRSNEDEWLGNDELQCYIVCDGVGGRPCGGRASTEAVEKIWDWILSDRRAREQALADAGEDAVRGAVGAPLAGPLWRRHLRPARSTADYVALVRGALQHANYMLWGMGEEDPACRGMSTTASVVLLVGGVAIVAQVGDTRVYLARGGDIRQLTEDHTLVNLQVKQGLLTPEQARDRRDSQITRALGMHEYVEVDVQAVPVQVGDRLLLCSDGLHHYFDGGEMLRHLFRLDLRDTAREAIRYANRRGGKDNITAVFVELLPD